MVIRYGLGRPNYSPNDDCYTPPQLFETMAITFDLDVCAPKGGVPWIPAARHYSIDDDGLSQPWQGRVWMNPPFSKITPWAERFRKHKNGVALLPFSKSKWCNALWDDPDLVITYPYDLASKFIKDGTRKSIYTPVILCAYQKENIEAISRVGRVR